MGERANLTHTEAAAKIRNIARGEVAMLHTFADNGGTHVRPMGTPGVDLDGTIWFLSRTDSLKNYQIQRNPRTRVTYSVHSRSEYLALEGEAMVLRDQNKIDELWSAFDKTWFAGGKHDPSISLIRFVPRSGHYWDTSHGKMVQLLGIAFGALTGKQTDDGIEGNLRP